MFNFLLLGMKFFLLFTVNTILAQEFIWPDMSKLPFHSFIEKASNVLEFVEYNRKTNQVPLFQNPLLKDFNPNSFDERIIKENKIDMINVELKGAFKHIGNPAWSYRFWEAVIKLKTYIARKRQNNEHVDVIQLLKMIGQWRLFVQHEYDLTLHYSWTNWLLDYSNTWYYGIKDYGHWDTTGTSYTEVGEKENSMYGRMKIKYGNDYRDIISFTIPTERESADDVLRKMLDRDATDEIGLNDAVFYVQTLENRPRTHKSPGIYMKSGNSEYAMVEYIHEDSFRFPGYKKYTWNVFSHLDKLVGRNKLQSMLNHVLNDKVTNEASLKQYTKKVASIHWFVANSAPFVRGTAAAADILTATLLLLQGYQWPGWKNHMSADVTALCTAKIKTYQAQFSDMMAAPPVKVNLDGQL
jgi:hypothetical protein